MSSEAAAQLLETTESIAQEAFLRSRSRSCATSSTTCAAGAAMIAIESGAPLMRWGSGGEASLKRSENTIAKL